MTLNLFSLLPGIKPQLRGCPDYNLVARLDCRSQCLSDRFPFIHFHETQMLYIMCRLLILNFIQIGQRMFKIEVEIHFLTQSMACTAPIFITKSKAEPVLGFLPYVSLFPITLGEVRYTY